MICFGHHHPTHFFTGKEATYLNPGSLGCNHKPAAPYALINFSKKKFEITLQETEYDNEDFLKSYYDTNGCIISGDQLNQLDQSYFTPEMK